MLHLSFLKPNANSKRSKIKQETHEGASYIHKTHLICATYERNMESVTSHITHSHWLFLIYGLFCI